MNYLKYGLKVHSCRFENLPISLSSHENNVEDFTLLIETCAREICGKFVYKHSEAIEYVKNYLICLRNLRVPRINKSRILRIKNAKFAGYFLYERKPWPSIFARPNITYFEEKNRRPDF